MKNEFTAIIERDGDWYIAYCPEIPDANGQGRTKDEARKNLAEAIELILEDRREDALRGVPPDAIRETVTRSGARCSSTSGDTVAISSEKEVLTPCGPTQRPVLSKLFHVARKFQPPCQKNLS